MKVLSLLGIGGRRGGGFDGMPGLLSLVGRMMKKQNERGSLGDCGL